jgi:translocation and assembly module TamB
LAIAVMAVGCVLIVALLVAWGVRFRVATALVDRKLAAARVPASYQITRIGPFLERMEHVRIGDPDAPDLIARRLDVMIDYGFSGPRISGVTIDGVRLRGRFDMRGLHLGALDRLIPKSSGKAGLPDLPLSIRDAELALLTPAGAISATLAGDGNPARSFSGESRLVALALQSGGCTVRDVAATLKLAVREGEPRVSGPVRISGVDCPQQKAAVGPAAAQVALSSGAAFERLTFDANLTGSAGRVQDIGFAALSSTVTGSRSSSGFGALIRLDLQSTAAPRQAQVVARLAAGVAGTPLGPVVDRMVSGASALLRHADATAEFNVQGRANQPLEVRLSHLGLRGGDGARVDVTEEGGIAWTRAGLRTDAAVETSGGDLPTLALRLQQASAGAPIEGLATMQPYRVGQAQLAATPMRFRWEGGRADFDTVLTIDGPLDAGYVRGLTVPVKGYAISGGAVMVGAGCETILVRQLRLTSFAFGGARIPVCGRPLFARTEAGLMRIDATTGPVLLNGRTSDGAPIRLSTSGLRLTQAGFHARDLTAALGGPDKPTRLSISALDGRFGSTLGGQFTGAAGAIGNVPLDIADASGGWTFREGALRLNGTLRISDAENQARFNPLAAQDAVLALKGGTIVASATLREPVTAAMVAKVGLQHDLAGGRGHALLDLPGITFVPKGLQPEQLTPLTLGVIANVAGTISGRGRIDWNADGVTSTGDFGTDRIDLAAAFGPVTGISGKLHFTNLLGLVSAPDQQAVIAEINPGVAVTNGRARYQLIGQSRVRIVDAQWPFAGGSLRLEPTTLNFGADAERQLTFRIDGLDAAAFVQQLDFPNISATGTFDGVLPMIFDQGGGRIEGGSIVARKSGAELAYVGELSNAQLGTMGKLAFDALKAIRYSALDISLDGRLDGEMVSRVRFTGIRQATPQPNLAARLIRNLPFRFNISIRAPFRGLVGSARAYIDPRLLLTQVPPAKPTQPPVQTPASGDVR